MQNVPPMPAISRANIRVMARQLLPGLALPGLVYFALHRHVGTMPALAAASSVPALDSIIRLVRGKRPTFVGTVFLVATALSVGLATAFHEPWFITGKGAALSALLGLALVLSAGAGRPLTRTIALRLCTDDPASRRSLAERWARPKTVAVFRRLAAGWGLWLLLSAIQQAAMVAAVGHGMFMAVEPPIRAGLTALGVLASVVYVRRRQNADPELALLPARAGV